MKIRRAIASDSNQIRNIHLNSFPDEGEADLVQQLKIDSDQIISLITEADGKIIAHVIFSTMTAPFRVLGLGPVAVLQQNRRNGIAAQLIKAGIQTAKEENYDAIFVLGEPDYYQRFGFELKSARQFDCMFAGPHFMVLPLQTSGLPTQTGKIEYASAFTKL